jgi:hypothetical protein
VSQATDIVDLLQLEVDFANDGSWTEITGELRHFDCQSGATRTESPILRYEPGNANFQVRNNNRDFDPTNLNGPYVETSGGGGTETGIHQFNNEESQFYGQGWTINIESAPGQTATIRDVSAYATGTDGSFSVPKPSGVVSGDLLIALHFVDIGTLSDMGTPSGGASWGTVTDSRSEGDDSLLAKMWDKTAGGSEPSTYGFTQNSGADGVVFIVAIQAGTWTGTPVIANQSNPETAAFLTPTTTPSGENDLEIRAVAGTVGGSGSTWSAADPDLFTELADLQSQTFTTGALYSRTLTSEGEVGTATLIRPRRPVRAVMPWTFDATTNLVTNPSGEIDLSGIETFANGTIDRNGTHARWGEFSIEVRRVNTAPAFFLYGATYDVAAGITNGETATITAYVYIPAAAWANFDGVVMNANTISGSFVDGPTQPDTWTRCTLTGVASGNVTEVQVQIWTDDGHADGQIIAYIDGVQIEQSATATAYCDGSQPGCTWSGTEHASSSSRSASVDFPVWRGFAAQWDVDWVPPNFSVVTAPCFDAMTVLSRNSRTAVAATGAGEDTGARVDRILDSADWPADLREIATGDTTVQATVLEGSAQGELELTADTELGELFIDARGYVIFRNRKALITESRSVNNQAVFNDAADGTDADQGLPYHGLGLSYDAEQFANFVIVGRENGGTRTTFDQDSIDANNGVVTFERSGLIMESDDEAQAFADWILYISKEPELRFSEIVINPLADPDRLMPQVLARKIGDRIKVIFHPPGGGDPIQREAFIRGIKHDINPSTWVTTWALQSASKVGSFLTFDHPVLGILGQNAIGY